MARFLATLGLALVAVITSTACFAQQPKPRNSTEDNYWVEPMAQVHKRFTGKPGTFAHFGDSITVSMAFWAPLAGKSKGLSPAAAAALARVKQYMHSDCWHGWKGPQFGSNGGMTIRWAHENLDDWLKRLNPEVALIMFGTNDLGQLDRGEFEEKTRAVARRCLKNGTIVILNTIPPASGRLDKSREFAQTVARIAREEKVPLVDYFAEVLRRRPDDWDGSLAKFKDVAGDEYQVPTLVSRDGVHPSYPRKYAGDFSEQSLRVSGYNLRSYLVLLQYSRVIQHVLKPDPKPQKPKPVDSPRGSARADHRAPRRFPHRSWAACDFEGQTPDYGWFGPAERKNIPRYPGNATALGVSQRPYQNTSAVMTGINPVPGPRMGQENQLFLRYYLRGGDRATFQHFSLSSEDNQHIHVTGLRQGTWSELSLNFTRGAARNDGSPGSFQEGERMDDFKVFAGRPDEADDYTLFIDDLIFFADDASREPEPEPFPRRVIFLAAFDTGPPEKYWPGEFELAEKNLPPDSFWRVARAVPRKADSARKDDSNKQWIRLQIEPPRLVGAHTKLRFRYWQRGVRQLTVQVFDATDQDNRHVVVKDLKPATWTNRYLDFTRDGRRNDGTDTRFAAGHMVDDLFFFVEPQGDANPEFLIDEVVLYDAGEDAQHSR
jgi:lysophospholipase L1-like esterase